MVGLAMTLSARANRAGLRSRGALGSLLPDGAVGSAHGAWSALSPAERRVVFAHEAAHLHGRHHVWRALADVASRTAPIAAAHASAFDMAFPRW